MASVPLILNRLFTLHFRVLCANYKRRSIFILAISIFVLTWLVLTPEKNEVYHADEIGRDGSFFDYSEFRTDQPVKHINRNDEFYREISKEVVTFSNKLAKGKKNKRNEFSLREETGAADKENVEHPMKYLPACPVTPPNLRELPNLAILTFSPTWNSMIKILSIGRMDNFKTFFKNGNFCANASF